MDNEFRFAKPKLPSAKVIILLLVLLLVGITAATSLFSVDQTEDAVVLRFGRYVRTVGPGLQMKLPFGIEKNYNVETNVVKTMTFGYRATDPTGTTRSLLPLPITRTSRISKSMS